MGGGEDSRLERLGRKSWALLGIVGVLVLAWLLVSQLAVVVVPVVLALFAAAALAPVVDLLVRVRLPRPLGALLAVVLGFAVVAGAVLLVVPPFVAQLPHLSAALGNSAKQADRVLSGLPFLGPDVDLAAIARRVAGQLLGGGSIPAALGTVVTALSSAVLLVVVVLFYLAEGRWLAAALVGWLPRARQDEVWRVAVELWHVVGRYFRALLVVALFDAVFIGAGLALLSVPLAFPLAVLVYLGAFLPYLGAVVSGMLAVLVAAAERGIFTAVLVLVVVLVVQQVEGNVLQPLVMGKIVRVPAFVVLVVIAVGSTLLGVLGAFLAVPAAACTDHVLRHLRGGTDERG